ncbi:MAG: PQQ-dependent sugar dehydrogenase [Phycisphaerales bacterium]
MGGKRGAFRTVSLILPWVVLGGSVLGGDLQITTELVGNIQFPRFVTAAPGDFERVFVISRHGLIFVIRNGTVLDDPFIDLTDIVNSVGPERGLLGMAFHPDYEQNGYFYVDYTGEPDGRTVVARYQVTADPDVADRDSAQPLLEVEQPTPSHNAGWIGFGPNDCYLYVSLGDGGGAWDPDDHGQNLDSLLGTILRIDVDGDDFPNDPDRNYTIPPDNPFVGREGADEIWVYGLRNPWRCGFDRETGDLYFGDVGAGSWEEINFQPASSLGGENYGWDCKEGTHCTAQNTCDCADPTLVDPIFEYPHPGGNGSAAVIGGAVYRGCAIPQLVGAYIVADYLGQIWLLRYDGKQITELREIQDELDPPGALSLDMPVAISEDAFGELYICDRLGGEVYKIVPAGEVNPDCNKNGVPDACDIASGTSPDVNNNGIPDECEVVGDINGDGSVGSIDLILLLTSWGSCDECDNCDADLNGDCIVGAADLLILLANWG